MCFSISACIAGSSYTMPSLEKKGFNKIIKIQSGVTGNGKVGKPRTDFTIKAISQNSTDNYRKVKFSNVILRAKEIQHYRKENVYLFQVNSPRKYLIIYYKDDLDVALQPLDSYYIYNSSNNSFVKKDFVTVSRRTKKH